MKMIKYLVPFLFCTSLLFAQEEISNDNNYDESLTEDRVDCLILEDENSIICKFDALRSLEDQGIIVQWIDPQGDISRSREMMVPAGHGSIYDYRYIQGRTPGNWTFKVITNDREYATQFEVK